MHSERTMPFPPPRLPFDSLMAQFKNTLAAFRPPQTDPRLSCCPGPMPRVPLNPHQAFCRPPPRFSGNVFARPPVPHFPLGSAPFPEVRSVCPQTSFQPMPLRAVVPLQMPQGLPNIAPIISDSMKEYRLLAAKTGLQLEEDINESDESYMSESEEELEKARSGEWVIDQGEKEAYRRIRNGMDHEFHFFPGDSGKSLSELPEAIRKYDIYYRRFNLIYFRCDSFKGKMCKGKFVRDVRTGEEASRGHTIPRAEHSFYEMLHSIDSSNHPKNMENVLKNERLREDIAGVVKQQPLHATRAAIVSTLSNRHPAISLVNRKALEKIILEERRKIMPVRAKMINPLQVKTLRGHKFGREYVTNSLGEFFIMFSDFQDNFIQLCKKDTVHLFVDASYKCVPPGYTQLLYGILHSYDRDIYVPIYQALLPSRDLECYKYILEKLKEMLENHFVVPKFISCSFERALVRAFTTEFPQSQFVGCFYQYAHALWAKANYLTLLTEEFFQTTKTLLFELMSLAFKNKLDMDSSYKIIIDKYAKLSPLYSRFFCFFRSHFLVGCHSLKHWEFRNIILNPGPFQVRLVEGSTAVEASLYRLNRTIKRFHPTCVDTLSTLKAVENFKRLEFEQLMEKKTMPFSYRNLLLDFFVNSVREGCTEFEYINYRDDIFQLDLDKTQTYNAIRSLYPMIKSEGDLSNVKQENTEEKEGECDNKMIKEEDMDSEKAERKRSCEELEEMFRIAQEDQAEEFRQPDPKPAIKRLILPKMGSKFYKFRPPKRAYTFMTKLHKHLEKNQNLKRIAQLGEVQDAKTVPKDEWEKIEPKTVFKGQDGVIYYKKLNGEVMEMTRLAEYLLSRIQKRPLGSGENLANAEGDSNRILMKQESTGLNKVKLELPEMSKVKNEEKCDEVKPENTESEMINY